MARALNFSKLRALAAITNFQQISNTDTAILILGWEHADRPEPGKTTTLLAPKHKEEDKRPMGLNGHLSINKY